MHCNDVDSDYICEDCALDDAKEQEVECHNAEAEDHNIDGAKESQSGYRGDPCIGSYGDAIDEDLCYENPTQLEHCTMGAVGDVKEHEMVCYLSLIHI